MLPQVLQNIPGIEEFNPHSCRGIYFLLLDDRIVYIGQSDNIHKRIKQHLFQREKVFNKILVKYICDPAIDLASIEKDLIKAHKPKYNSNSKNPRKLLKLSLVAHIRSFVAECEMAVHFESLTISEANERIESMLQCDPKFMPADFVDEFKSREKLYRKRATPVYIDWVAFRKDGTIKALEESKVNMKIA
jgi:hypothetical protein